jgi:hypothetical protein
MEFFSSAFFSELGHQLAWKLGRSAPVVNRADFALVQELLPNPADYKDFEAQLRPKRGQIVVVM